MKVKDMVKVLNQMPQEAEVFLSSDQEGNSYSTIEQQNITHIGEKSVVLYPWKEGVEVPGME